MTQNERVLKFMNDFGSITPMEAMEQLGIYRLAARIHDLIREGHHIEKEIVSNKNRYGDVVHYARYSRG